MKQYAKVIKEKLGKDVDQIAGAGAAGGLGAALCVFLHANLKSGIETVLDLSLIHISGERRYAVFQSGSEAADFSADY